MKKIESFLLGKNKNQDLCEDGIYEGERIIAVIDGATSKGNNLIDGKSSGCFAKDALIGCLRQNELDLSKMPAPLLYETLNDHLRACTDEDTLQLEDYPRACMAVYNEERHELSAYGDCQFILNGQRYGFEKKIDRLNSEYRALVLELELSDGKSIDELMQNDTGREGIRDTLKRQMIFENKDSEYAYPVLNGYSFNKDMVFSTEVETGSEIVLATDGYPFLETTLEQSERELKKLLEDDPLCMRIYKSTKGLVKGNLSYDDRAYWRGIAE